MKTQDFVLRTSHRYDSYALKREWATLSSRVDTEDRQISLTHTPDCAIEKRWSQGNGSLFWEHKNPQLKYSEKDFSLLNEELIHFCPYLWKVCSDVRSFFKIGRIRFMTMDSGYAYPQHHDFERRWHLPILAPSTSFLYFRLSEQNLFSEDLWQSAHGVGFHIPDDGYLYQFESGLNHTACNPGSIGKHQMRVHLVFNEAID